ncbi:CerR family C-terminal domain-containing protein [Rhodoferax sp. PAMC 29310]|uniref:TetR/AcrR family transcriptional regulator n=1 Tax=Rhodoferax sp. PAMC 29310 TaxID=2822760 RepID=UPI001B326A02|nr:CerR family C-terminal domain-containing protein [Rhodoferax sp. PAMC 29310]
MKLDTPVPKELRIDGQEARTRLLDAALTLFAEKGFAATSIRELALAAQVNVSAISYYFGDKAGLYRALFQDPRINPPVALAPAANLAEAIRGLLTAMTEPLKQSDAAQQCVKLFMREMLEPTGVWQAEIENNIQPAHLALVDGLCRHLATTVDDDIHRLAFSIAGLGVMLQLSTDVYRTIRPSLNDTPQAIDAYTDRLLEYALTMVAAEAQRRQIVLPQPSPTPHPETAP